MPAFIANGPEIPEGLLQAHEEGRVVFFCGAGISYMAGLPGFGGLVSTLYEHLGVSPNAIQQAAIKAGQYDTAIGLLEADHPGEREAVRGAIAEILKPKKITSKTTATHSALLTLGKTKKGQMRLITTNFDRLFAETIEAEDLEVESYMAPLLPVPKNRWDGLVYLHGLLPLKPNVGELHRLVVSSGDFGLAYLTERWASRFVSELFRNYTVCFIGYSINDPVLRYMTDALAADRLLGESSPKMYAFGSYSKGKEKRATQEWESKNVTPILYPEHKKHFYLHKTLQEWAKTYRDGVRGKQMLVTQHASTPPLAPSRTDFAVGRVLWALTDSLAAKHFAELSPIPSLKWLEPLSKNWFGHDDLIRFGVFAGNKKNTDFQFSALRRPAPYALSPRMCLVDYSAQGCDWDDVMEHLARWLLRHLNNSTLILWFAQNGGLLNGRLIRMIRGQIEKLDKMAAANEKEELKQLLSNSPDAVPDLSMRALWGLLLSGRVASNVHNYDLYDWFRRLKLDGLSTSLRIELRRMLAPVVKLREPYSFETDQFEVEPRIGIRAHVNWEIELASDHVHAALSDKEDFFKWQDALPRLLPEFNALLLDVLELMEELGGADKKADSSYILQPSIVEHPQNNDFHDWTALIMLARDSWLATANSSADHARKVAQEWWETPYPVFKRLALFAATLDGIVPLNMCLDWLLSEGCWWLWSCETKRETLRLLVAIGPKLESTEQKLLETAILTGPPREMFRDELDEKEWKGIVDREIWLLLAKLDQASTALNEETQNILLELSRRYPDWTLSADEREEFPFWMGDGEEGKTFIKSPTDLEELIDWLKKNVTSDHWKEDDWRQRCSNDFETTFRALSVLSEQKIWLADRWREALQGWVGEVVLEGAWQDIGEALLAAPNDLIKSIAHALSRWLQKIAKVFSGHESVFLKLCDRILELPFDEVNENEKVASKATNHPVGIVTEALIKWWYRGELENNQGLSDTIEGFFTKISDFRAQRYRYGRVLLAAHTISLYRVDPKWTREKLLPLFDWKKQPMEAPFIWDGFLWSPRLYRPLLIELKASVLATAKHYEELGEYASQYADFLTFAALDPADTFTKKELAEATRSLPVEGLNQVSQVLYRALEGAGEQYGEYWKNRIAPYIKNVWPKSRDFLTPTISGHFGRLCIAAQEFFSEVFEVLKYWIRPVEHPGYLVHLLCERNICTASPTEALNFLDLIIIDEPQWVPRELIDCLMAIRQADHLLEGAPSFDRLMSLANKRIVP